VYCILDKAEMEQWTAVEVLLRLEDEQGSPIALVRVPPGCTGIAEVKQGGSTP
jgi:hypothetical protein